MGKSCRAARYSWRLGCPTSNCLRESTYQGVEIEQKPFTIGLFLEDGYVQGQSLRGMTFLNPDCLSVSGNGGSCWENEKLKLAPVRVTLMFEVISDVCFGQIGPDEDLHQTSYQIITDIPSFHVDFSNSRRCTMGVIVCILHRLGMKPDQTGQDLLPTLQFFFSSANL